MKKALSLIMVFLVAVAFSATGYSADKYISGNIGMSWMNNSDIEDAAGIIDILDAEVEMDYGSGLTGTGALGCDYGDYRLEGEVGYQSGDIDGITFDFTNVAEAHGEDIDVFGADLDGDVSVLTLMVNGYYDIDLGGIELSPFVGVGVAKVTISDLKYDGDLIEDAEHPEDLINDLNLDLNETTLAYQAGVVIGIPVADNVMVDARYRYFATTDLTTLALLNTNVDSHSAMLGLRFGL
ncbi:MAG: outer membrane beta-barrel protein [Prosthecochloris sp.]|uniref:Surface antigen msp4 family protein n=1 Tax=Prosthecochloris aestuarii (strain DSM 271 / SK 413) TaxID=290512 RepID=B4S4V7_PROA2|nr:MULTISPECIES: outer membrane beta-barrel protein [Prosthecochloris]ACF45455.1 surface antigen msp4 family protein [Prosthecochloris aestuarii DSM 271]MCW8797914.1 outer membrane beta-barrel protein [Prosthecochloris sp.]